MEQSAEARTEQLEKLVSSLRHDLRGAVTPVALLADRLKMNGDPAVQRSASMIATVVERIVTTLNRTYDVVPPRGSGPVIGANAPR
jgi:hypothetical protein